jgi:hypothetical protein
MAEIGGQSVLLRSNQAVDTDAQGRPRQWRSEFLGRRSLLRYVAWRTLLGVSLCRIARPFVLPCSTASAARRAGQVALFSRA